MRLTLAQDACILAVYKECGNIRETGRRLGFDPSTVSNKLKHYKIPTVLDKFNTNGKKCFKYTEIFLEDDAKLGYICGLIASDGNLAAERPRISISLEGSDRPTLDFLSKELAVEGIYILDTQRDGRRPMVGLSAELHKLYQYCLDMGITPKKSLTLDPKLEGKSKDFIRYFIRGVLDGDGTVVIKKPLQKSTVVFYSSSRLFIEQLYTLLGGYIYECTKECINSRSSTPHIRATASNFRLELHHKSVRSFLEAVPLDVFTMSRKTEKLKLLKEFFTSYTPWQRNGNK